MRFSRSTSPLVLLLLLAAACFLFPLRAAAQNVRASDYPAYKAELESFQSAFNGGAEDRGEAIARAGIERAAAASDRSAAAHWTRLLGASYQVRNRWREARNEYERSLAIRRELNQPAEMLVLTSGLGFVCYTTSDYAAARRYLQEARTLAAESGTLLDQARASFTLGLVERAERNFSAAAQAFDDALRTYREAGPAGQSGVALSHLEYARLNADRALLPEALREGFEAVRLLSAMPKREADTARGLDMIGSAFHYLEEPSKALEYFRRSLDVRNKAKVDPTESYQLIAVELDQLGRHDEAIRYLELVLANRRKAGRAPELASALINLAVAEQNLGRMDAARNNFSEALRILPADRARARQRSIALYGLGNVDIAEGKLDDALTHHQEALAIRREIGDSLGVVRSLNRLGIALEKASRWEDALNRHMEAAAAFEKLLAGVRNPVQAVSFRATSAILYPHYTRVLVQLGRTSDALAVAERARGTGLDRVTSLGTPPPSVMQAAHRASAARNQFRIAFDSGVDEESAQVAYLNAVQELSRTLDVPSALESGSSRGRSAAAPSESGFQSLAAAHPDTLFLEWVGMDDEATILFTLSARDGLKAYTLPAPVAQIQQLVDRWYESLKAPARTRGVRLTASSESVPTAREPEEAALVAEAVFGDVASRMDGFSRLALVPDGPLLKIPFTALVDKQGRRLTDRFSISTAVSLTSLLNTQAAARTGGKVYAVGDPTEGGQTVSVVPQRIRLAALAGARNEVRSIAELLPGSTVALGQSAREADVKRQMASFDVLHFATHGVLDAADPLRSALLLAPEPAGSSEDGLLEGWEIATLRLNARLAVLSACDTGQGRETLSDGVLGLSWAFQAAGCPNVIATLWSVDDAATQSIMVAFYKALRRGERIDDALRDALRAVRSDPSYPPYYWAAFQIVGPAGPVFNNSQSHAPRATAKQERKK